MRFGKFLKRTARPLRDMMDCLLRFVEYAWKQTDYDFNPDAAENKQAAKYPVVTGQSIGCSVYIQNTSHNTADRQCGNTGLIQLAGQMMGVLRRAGDCKYLKHQRTANQGECKSVYHIVRIYRMAEHFIYRTE